MAKGPEVVVKDGGVEGINLFGKVDVNKHGNVGSEMPAWYFRSNKEDLYESIRSTESSIERGQVSEEHKPQILADLKKMREKYDAIMESEPKYDGNQQDIMAKTAKELGSQIKESMFSRTDMMRGTADAHEEARRMVEPCIEMKGEAAVLAKKMNCRISRDGMVSRNDAQRVWKVLQRSLGENSNTEILRRG